MINKTSSTLWFIVFVGLFLCSTPYAAAQHAELDAYWAEVSRTVKEGDFEGYAALYHEDAVLVSSGNQSSYPIAEALAEWKQGFVDTKAGKTTASVEFRFSSRLTGESTAHETGIFYYQSTPEGGETSGGFVHFDALSIKKDGIWLMMMEHQKAPATQEEWDALH